MPNNDEVFKNQESAFIARYLLGILEDVVRDAQRLLRGKDIPLFIVARAFERRALPLIEGIVGTLNPERSEYVREIHARVIWGVYWGLRNGPAETQFHLFALLAQLNNQPLFASPSTWLKWPSYRSTGRHSLGGPTAK
jgi:hypothetical protein